MPVTRSASRQISHAPSAAVELFKFASVASSRLGGGVEKKVNNLKKAKKDKSKAEETQLEYSSAPAAVVQVQIPRSQIITMPPASSPTFLPADLTFSLQEAKEHLIAADPRFEDIFNKLNCRPFEHLERVDPFRTLVVSILGQQISWLAARSITHRFVRLFDPTLPEKPVEGSSQTSNTIFPSAHQVCCMDIPTLRSAGLSGRKAEYVLDLASRFADGRLSSEKIFEASDEELYEMLVAVRGIGKWTVDMFAMFSLRRPDILPVGDLGVQRGLLRWILALHSPDHGYVISPKKLPKAPSNNDALSEEHATRFSQEMQPDSQNGMGGQITHRSRTPDISSSSLVSGEPKTPVKRKETGEHDSADSLPAFPPAFTPSIDRTLNKLLPTQYKIPSLPDGLTVNEMKARLNGKKKVKGAFLTPKEMEALTESWKPYRSLGVYYMWTLSSPDDT